MVNRTLEIVNAEISALQSRLADVQAEKGRLSHTWLTAGASCQHLWAVYHRYAESESHAVLNTDGVPVAFAVSTTGDTSHVHVLAAAPELLRALEGLWASYKALADSGDSGDWYAEDTEEGQRALQAIAKAKGKSK